jgi:hypothetical protein
MTFNLTNVGSNDLQFGGVGIPLPFADNWVGRDAADTWERCAVSDPAISLDTGYVIANRLTGRAPTLITAPVGKSEFDRVENWQSLMMLSQHPWSSLD